jgi:hypothetical protein
VIACASAAEESLTPYIITSQASRQVRERLKKHGVRFAPDFVLRSNLKLDSNTKSFLDYIRTVFLPKLAELRRLDGFSGETGVLLTSPRFLYLDFILSRKPGLFIYPSALVTQSDDGNRF